MLYDDEVRTLTGCLMKYNENGMIIKKNKACIPTACVLC
jgi:hypothetical protein